MVTIRVESFDNIDLDAYAAAQRLTFDALLTGSGVSNAFMTSAFYRWKYDAPVSKSRIAIAADGSTILASNAMVPYLLRSTGSEFIGWQSTDTATIPQARGKGLFLKCVQALREDLGPGTLFFGYPNSDSRRGFVRLGWIENCTVRVWLSNAWWPGPVPASVRPVRAFGPEFDRLATRLTEDGRTALIRNAAFMHWRFTACPATSYESFAFYAGQDVRGLLVVREARVKGRNICLVMELWGETPPIRRALAAKARQWARQRSLLHLILFDNQMSDKEGWMTGFLRVPKRFLPKHQILMGEGVGECASRAMGHSWHVQLGDWDGF